MQRFSSYERARAGRHSRPAQAPVRGKQAPDGAFFNARSTPHRTRTTREPSMSSEIAFEQTPRMSGAKIVLQALRDNGVRHIFGYPGAAVLPIYDELFQQE